MINITKHSHEELGLIVMNTERLYKVALNTPAELHQTISESYTFTSEQYNVLAQTVLKEAVRLKRERDFLYGMRGRKNYIKWNI
tara:strand:+ start:209 stop:460 length:252 start_codon:yes stop_codon:yes gene_type:complete